MLLALAALALAIPLKAQAVVLVSNIAKSDKGASWPGSQVLYAQGFRTGGAPTTLTSIEVKLSATFNNQNLPDMTLHRGSAHSRAIATLTRPQETVNISTAKYSYTAPANVVLSESTTYYMVLTPRGKSRMSPHITRSTGEDNTSRSGWSIKDRRRWKPIYNFPGEYFDRRDPIMIGVNGTVPQALSISDASGVEGRTVNITVSLTEAASTEVTVKWRLVPGTATADDYNPPLGDTLTIAAGQKSTTLAVFLTDDTRHENPETFSVELYDAEGAVLSSRRRATVTIKVEEPHRKVGVDQHGREERSWLDLDYPRVTVSGIPDTVVDTSSETMFTVQVKQENVSDVGDFTVGIYTANGTAQAPGDFTYLARGLSFPKGTTTSHAVSISVANDALTEGPETFEIRVGQPTMVGTARCCVQTRHTVTILDSAIDSSTVENTGPTLVESFTDGTGAEIHFTMSENLDLSNLPPASAFTVTVDGSNATVSAVARGGVGIQTDTVKISVSPVVGQGQTVVVAYADPTAGNDANAIQDVFGNDAPSFTTGSDGVPAVTNSSTVSMQVAAPTITGSPALSESGSDGTWTAGETVEVTLTFSEAVTVDTTGGTPSLGLDLGGTESRRAPYLRGSGTTALVFGYTLVDADGSHTSMLVPIDSLALNNGTIRSQATSAAAALSHNGAAKSGSTTLGTRDEPDAFTARFGALPESHDGSGAFTFEMHFSAAPEGLSHTTVAGGLLDVTGAAVTKARRLTPGSNLGWEVTLTPSQSGDIAIRLPARACTETNAVCVGGSPLGNAVSATVPGIPFTASFSGVPAEHDGATAFDIRFHLSAEPATLSYRTVQNGLFAVTGGRIEKASRLVAGKNNGWTLRIDPTGLGDVTVRVNGTTACDTAPGVCTADGRKLAGGLSVSTAGPPTLSVADATVEESADATLAFTVTLSKARFVPTTVQYATSDGSAAAGSDYTAQSGTLTFGRLETSQTISVPILDDVIDEGSETLTLTLSDPSDNVRLGDATATGTITNSDPFQHAWLARFGRTVGTHVTDAVGERLRAAPGQASHVTIGGYRLPLKKSQPGDAESEADPLTALVTGLAGLALGPDPTGPERDNTDPRLGQPRTAGLPSVRLRDVLLGSSFRLNVGADPAGGLPSLTAWGRVAGTQFDGRDGLLTIDGDVLTGTAGVDGTWDRWLAGVAISHSRGDGTFTLTDPGAAGRGEVAQTLTSIHPYLRYAVTDRLDVWGLLGYGWGELELKPADGRSLETDTAFLMGSIGSRGILLPATETGGFELATRTDAMFTRTTSDAVSSPADRGGNLAGAVGDAHRVRLILEGSREVTWAEGRSLTPTMEVGLRHDWGDAETGFGVELGGRIRYADPRLGLTIEGAVRGLLAHEDNDYDEWGASGSLRLAPGSAGQGLTLTLAPTWGAASSGVDGLWSQQTTRGIAQTGAGTPAGRLNAEVGYGFAAFDTGLLTPYAGAVLSDGAARTYRLGTRLRLTGRGTTGLAITLEGQRQEPAGQQPLNQGLQLQATWGF